MQSNIYLSFNGNCLEAMTFYATTLGGAISDIFRNGDVPDPENRMPGGDDLVMNMSMRLGDSVFMAADAPPSMYREPQGIAVSLSPGSLAEAESTYKALSADARSVMMPLGETFWAERFAVFTDRFGTPWMMNFTGNRAAQ